MYTRSVSFKALYGFNRLGGKSSEREIGASENYTRKSGDDKITPPPVEKGRNISFQTGEQIVEKHATNRQYYEQQRPSVKTENTRRADIKSTPEEEASKQRVIQMFRMDVVPLHIGLAKKYNSNDDATAMLYLLEDTPANKFPFFERVCKVLNMRNDWDGNNMMILMASSKEILASLIKLINDAPSLYHGSKEELLKTIGSFVDVSLKIGQQNDPSCYGCLGKKVFSSSEPIISAFYAGLQAPDVFDRFLRDAHKIKSRFDYVFTFCGKEFAEADRRNVKK